MSAPVPHSPRRAWRWVAATLGGALVLVLATLAALNHTFGRLGVEAQARYLAMKQPVEHAGSREGNELACLNAALLSPAPASIDLLREGKRVEPAGIADAAEWIDRVVACTEVRRFEQDPEHVVGWGKNEEPTQQRSMFLTSVVKPVIAALGPTEENADRCVRVLRLAADLSHLGEAWSVNPRATAFNALGPCVVVLASAARREERARQLDEVRARFMTRRRYVEELEAHWMTRTLWRWIPPDERRLPAPELLEQRPWLDWDEARAVRRMHPIALELAAAADTPGPAREALSKALDEAGRSLLDDTRAPDLERLLLDQDVASDTLQWAAAVLRREPAPLPPNSVRDGDTLLLRPTHSVRWRVDWPDLDGGVDGGP